MTKKEFLDTLREKLLEEIEPMDAAYQVQYYEDYIDTEVRSGHSEEAVLDSLGDPYLIARTLIDNPESRVAYDSVVIPDEPVKPYKEPEKPHYGAYGGVAYEMPPEAETKTEEKAAEKMTGDVERELDAEAAAKREKLTKTITIAAIAIVALGILGLLIKVLAKALPVILLVIVVIGVLDVLRNKLH